MAGSEDWRKNVETHKMSPEEVKRAGVEASKCPPGHNPGGILHQRRRLPYNFLTIAAVWLGLSWGVWYFVLYAKKKPEATAGEVARVSVGIADAMETHPRK